MEGGREKFGLSLSPVRVVGTDRAVSPVEIWREEHALLEQMRELRRRGLIGVILADRGKYWLADDECDPWGSKQPITVGQMRQLVARFTGWPV